MFERVLPIFRLLQTLEGFAVRHVRQTAQIRSSSHQMAEMFASGGA